VAGGVHDYLKTLYLNLRRTQERGNNRLVAINNSGTMSPTNRHGETPLHIACQHGEPLEVILKLLEDPSTAVKTQDQHGCLPLHYACMNGQNSFGVIEALIEAYPVGLGVTNNDGKSPFGWDYDKTPGRFFSQFINFVVEPRWESEDSSRRSTLDKKYKIFRLLGHCKNYVPLDIVRVGYLNKHILESKEFVRWLNEKPCERSLVFFMVLEFYLHIAWITTFVTTSYIYFETPLEALGWRPTALIVFASIFLLQEMIQLLRFYNTNALLAYWLDLWNWIDLTAGILVVISAVKFLQEDRSDSMMRILMCTGCFQAFLFLSYLKKTFFPFSKFVSGVIKIAWAVIPFLVVSFVTLFTFGFMYFMKDQNESKLQAEASQHANATLRSSFQTVLLGFLGDTTEYTSVLDYFYGVTVVIVLLNVIIAVVSEEWEDAVAEANAAFWSYRLDLILEKTRGIDMDFSNPAYQRLRQLRPKVGSDLNEFYIDIETAGTSVSEMTKKLALAKREKGTIFCMKVILKTLLLILLGFPTMGIMWPKFFRQMLFTPPKPKERDEAGLSTEGSEREAHEREIAECRREVSELSQKVTAQNALLEQLLTKLSSKVE